MRAFKLFLISLARNLKSPKFYLSVLIGMCILLSERMGEFADSIAGKPAPQDYSFVFMLGISLSFTVFPFVFAPICTLAGSLGFCEDSAHHFFRPILSRISKKAYIGARFISGVVAGGIAGAAIILLSAILLRLVFPAHTLSLHMQTSSMPDDAVLILGGWGYVFKVAAAYFFGGMALAGAGLAISAIVPNRYVAVFAPLLLFTSIHFLMSYLRSFYTPLNLLMTYENKVSLYQIISIFGLACAALGGIFFWLSKKRLAGE